MPQTWERLKRLVRDERGIFALIVLVSALSSVVFAFEQLGQEQHDFIETWPRASWSKPWGLLTLRRFRSRLRRYRRDGWTVPGQLAPLHEEVVWRAEAKRTRASAMVCKLARVRAAVHRRRLIARRVRRCRGRCERLGAHPR